ncbi:IPT/TIG domain-containing protein, partial [Streptomyces sp. NBRC 13847]
TFNGVAATSIVVNGAGTSLTGTTPAGTAGNATVAVTTPGGTTTVPGGYTYALPGPTITFLSPNAGPTSGGTAFTIGGTNLTGASVTFNGVAATSIVVNGDGLSLTGITPPGPAGNMPVVVTTPNGSAAAPSGYTYS